MLKILHPFFSFGIIYTYKLETKTIKIFIFINIFIAYFIFLNIENVTGMIQLMYT